jgi:hypothetical protein
MRKFRSPKHRPHAPRHFRWRAPQPGRRCYFCRGDGCHLGRQGNGYRLCNQCHKRENIQNTFHRVMLERLRDRYGWF